MALLDLQTVLARLYTDRAFRALFFADPFAACDGMPLTRTERQQLVALDRIQVERFARSLRQKRLGLVRELLPATANVMRDRFEKFFFDYCDAQPSALERVDEALAFAAFLLDVGLTDPPYLPGCITCERLRLQALYVPSGPLAPCIDDPAPPLTPDACPQCTAHIRVAACRYDMETLYARVACGETVEAQPDACFVLIGKVRGAMRVRMKRINAPTAQLLLLCDGTRTLGEIMEEVARRIRLSDADKPPFAAECVTLLTPLVESGLLTLRGQTAPGECQGRRS